MNLGITQSIPAIENTVHQAQTWCEVCSNTDHATNICATNLESINYVGNGNRQGYHNFGITYNPR